MAAELLLAWGFLVWQGVSCYSTVLARVTSWVRLDCPPPGFLPIIGAT